MASTADLLLLIADGLDQGETPLNGAFLAEHGVSLDQAMTLAEQLAVGARIVAEGIRCPRSLQGHAMLMTIAEGI